MRTSMKVKDTTVAVLPVEPVAMPSGQRNQAQWAKDAEEDEYGIVDPTMRAAPEFKTWEAARKKYLASKSKIDWAALGAAKTALMLALKKVKSKGATMKTTDALARSKNAPRHAPRRVRDRGRFTKAGDVVSTETLQKKLEAAVKRREPSIVLADLKEEISMIKVRMKVNSAKDALPKRAKHGTVERQWRDTARTKFKKVLLDAGWSPTEAREYAELASAAGQQPLPEDVYKVLANSAAGRLYALDAKETTTKATDYAGTWTERASGSGVTIWNCKVQGQQVGHVILHPAFGLNNNTPYDQFVASAYSATGWDNVVKTFKRLTEAKAWVESKGATMKATDHAGSEPQDHLIRAASYEVQGDRARALDSYRAAASGFRGLGDVKGEEQARSGIEECQRRHVGSMDSLYRHPSAGKAQAFDSADKALASAVARTRAGEDVVLVGSTVRPGRARVGDANESWESRERKWLEEQDKAVERSRPLREANGIKTGKVAAMLKQKPHNTRKPNSRASSAALAASIGRKKYGEKAMATKSAAGRDDTDGGLMIKGIKFTAKEVAKYPRKVLEESAKTGREPWSLHAKIGKFRERANDKEVQPV